MNHKGGSDMADIRDSKLFIMYEKAVEGRNLHYQQYSTWMNLLCDVHRCILHRLLYIEGQPSSFAYHCDTGVYHIDLLVLLIVRVLCMDGLMDRACA